MESRFTVFIYKGCYLSEEMFWQKQILDFTLCSLAGFTKFCFGLKRLRSLAVSGSKNESVL